MACFMVPAAQAIVTTAITKAVKKNEKEDLVNISFSDGTVASASKIKFSTKLGWLNKMLWGGSALLAFEHIWHGEIVAYFPFLTAVENGQTQSMLLEMGSTGFLMSGFVTLVWGGMVLVSSLVEKKSIAKEDSI